ncbi:MAG TPA: AAA family ATPase [Gammaproteobacteria bacterium]|nr:AAA family ATPase [Gammaproteobacteria bacterium]
MRQDEALNVLKLGKNVFLTGEAGSGKTYLLNQYIHYLKAHKVEVAVTASTGIAATHLQGTTIHFWSGIGVRDHLTQKDLEKLRTEERIKRHYKKTKVLIIDEISMLHQYQLDMVDMIARSILDCDKPFGGIQVVLCGDFFQLPPVSSIASGAEKLFAFEGSAWKSGDFHVCYLHEQHRQGDDPLLAVLKAIRSGTAGEHTKIPLRTRYKKEPEGSTKATKLYSRNINVDTINDLELVNLQGEEKTFMMITEGFAPLLKGLKKNCLAVEKLQLKIGAEVMFIKNDMLGRYVNGTRCIVVGFDKREGWPIVKTYGGDIIVAYPEEWKYEDNGIVRATIRQVPLRLAWAITIHKSQGMTLDAVEIDLGDAFEPGMGYVALSRVRSLNGLKLMNLNEMALKVHPKILQQDSVFKEYSMDVVQYLHALSENEIIQCQSKMLIERFEGCVDKIINKTGAKAKKEKKAKKAKTIPTKIVTLEMLKKGSSLELIATTCGVTIATIISHIEKLNNLKQIEHGYLSYLKNSLPQNDFDLIFTELKLSEDGRLKPIYDKFEGKYSYINIRLVRLFL